MTGRDENHFAQELREMERRLKKLNRPVKNEGMVDGASGMNNNLSAPYSGPNRLLGEKWTQTELNAR